MIKKTPKPCAYGDERGSSVLDLGYILFRSLNAGTPWPLPQLVYLPRSATCIILPVYRPGPAFRQRCILAPEFHVIEIGRFTILEPATNQ